MEIKTFVDKDKSRWDSFVDSCAEATFFHKSGWRDVIQTAFGHPSHYLYAEENGAIQGVMPLGHVKSLLFGNSLISSPFAVYGGAVANTEQAREALERRACELAHELQVDHLEMRNLRPSGSSRPVKDLYVTFRKTIDPDPEKNLAAIPRKQRAMVRKGIGSNLSSVIDTTVDRLYDTYAESVRNLGTPVFSKKLFQTLKAVFGDDCEILSIEYQGRVVSSVMNFYFRDEVLPYYGGGTAEARDLYANDFMYWEVMRRACERGVRVFDYGRSKQGTGSYRFKTHWGFEPTPLYYEYELVKAKDIPDLNPLNPKYQLFIAAWKRLPLPLSKLIGPFLSRNLG
ncbi:MAG: FemAB family PEP-CTERM system-associated protein [Methylococcaceae bacterium]|nr:FemAB family PEP-CTERM system-associated protein [Methylococcaceae bacterium]